MLIDIEEKIEELINANIANPKHVDINEAHSALFVPSIDVIAGEGKFEKVAQDYKLKTAVFVIVTFQHLRSVRDRRKGVYPILEAIIACLVRQTLELKIDPLIPKRVDNITEKDEAEDGKIVMQIEFETGFIFNKLSEEEINDLITIGLNYYLKPGDDVADAQDIIETSST